MAASDGKEARAAPNGCGGGHEILFMRKNFAENVGSRKARPSSERKLA